MPAIAKLDSARETEVPKHSDSGRAKDNDRRPLGQQTPVVENQALKPTTEAEPSSR
jgi:hypothetical protein